MAASPDIELFSARVCPFAHRTRLALLEKGLDFALTEIDFKNKPQHFLEVSRYGKVPAIVHDGNEVYESAIINEYLEVAHAFFAGAETGLVNGVLDRLARTLRPREMEETKGGQTTQEP
jgi:glutathione S-transferase